MKYFCINISINTMHNSELLLILKFYRAKRIYLLAQHNHLCQLDNIFDKLYSGPKIYKFNFGSEMMSSEN